MAPTNFSPNRRKSSPLPRTNVALHAPVYERARKQATRYRLTMRTFVGVCVDAFEKLSDRQQADIIRQSAESAPSA